MNKYEQTLELKSIQPSLNNTEFPQEHPDECKQEKSFLCFADLSLP